MADFGDLIDQVSGAAAAPPQSAPPDPQEDPAFWMRKGMGKEQAQGVAGSVQRGNQAITGQAPAPQPAAPMAAPAQPSGFEALSQQLLQASAGPPKSSLEAPLPTETQPSAISAGPRSFLNALTAGAQGTSPNVTTFRGSPNYQLAPPEEQWAYRELGVPRDQQKYVALGGQVYYRNPAMEEGRLPALGRMLSLAVPETGIPTVGTAAAPNASQNLMRDFEQLKITPNIPAVGQNRIAGLTSQIANNIPFSSSVVRQGVGQTLSDTANAAERIAGAYGTARTPQEAGDVLQNAVTIFGKQKFPQSAAAMYDQFGQLMAGAGNVPLTNTTKAIGAPLARFPSSPELGSILTNPSLQKLTGALPPGSTLSFPELQEFRSTIGRAISDPMLVNDIPRSDLKRVYGGISADLENAARNQSPEALDAFRAANQHYQGAMKVVDALEPLLSGPAEQSFAKISQAAGSTAGANAALLNQAKMVMAPDEWNNVGAAVIRRMGEPPPGAKDILAGQNFHAPSFATNWNKISDAGKDLLFGPNVEGSNRSDLEALARVTQAQKNVAKLANTSHAAEHGILAGGGGAMIMSMFQHGPEAILGHISSVIGGAAGAHVAAKALMSPGFARWLYQMPTNFAQASSSAVGTARVLQGLDSLVRTNPELAPVRAALVAGAPQPAQ